MFARSAHIEIDRRRRAAATSSSRTPAPGHGVSRSGSPARVARNPKLDGRQRAGRVEER
jgi:hypothetical protein